MSAPGRAVMVGIPSATRLYDTIEAELKRRGHSVERHAGAAAFKAAAAPLADGDVLLMMGMSCTRELMASARLRAVVAPYVGTEHIDVAAATELGIVVAMGQTPENTIGMAEATIMLMLACLYDLHRSEKLLRESLPRPPQFARQARGKTIGLIGFGQIARAIVARLHGWETRILACTPRVRPPVPPGVEFVALEELLRRSDVVLVLSTLNNETRALLDAKRLALMKPDAVLINTARGGIIDEAALAEALRQGRLGKVALDVYETEPLPADSPLRNVPDMILTPHMVGQTRDNAAAAPGASIENASRALEGHAPLYVRNPEVLPEWERRWSVAPK